MKHAALLALALAFALPASAQQPQRPEPEAPAAEHARVFAEGLDALTRRRLPAAEAAFKRCVELQPDQAVNHYNLACVYAQAEKPEEAVAALTASFERGFVDLCHVARDADLDPLRRSPAFRAACEAHGKRVLDQTGPALSFVPEGKEDAPLLVWVHDQAADPARELARLKDALPGWALLVPQGVSTRRGWLWDGRCEFVVTERLRELREAQGWQEPEVRSRIVVAGEGGVALLAVQLAANHPDLFAGVLAAGPSLSAGIDDDIRPSGLRAYLLVKGDAADAVAAGVEARDAFVRAGSPVVLERATADKPISADKATLLRGLGWLRGEKVALPGAGAEVRF